MTLADATIDIYDPDRYVSGPPHLEFARLRAEAPVYRQSTPDGNGYWAILRHADVVTVARQPNLFSASAGGVVIEDLDQRRLESMRGMLLAMDPPRHVTYRKPLAGNFKAKVIGALEERVRHLCRDLLAAAAERGDVELVHDVTAPLPSRVVGELMGLPREDLATIHHWAEQLTTSQDEDYVGSSGNGDQASLAMYAYAVEFAAGRRSAPRKDDLTDVILRADFGGSPMTDEAFGSFFVQLVTAGNDTTKTMLSSGLLCLLEHPAQLAALRHDPHLIPGAVEEILRFANPLHYFRRTATADTELGGQRIRAGDKVAMYYTSANRDETVFPDSQRFDIRRRPNPHLTFGIAEHYCLGVHLARLEGRVFFEELLGRFSQIELTGPPVRVRSNLNNALKSLPVQLTT
jgi:cytochrome P450